MTEARESGRLAIALLTLLAFLFCAQLALAIARQPSLIWNEIRWSRSLALARGFPIYTGRDDLGGIVGTLHTPVSHLLYLAAIGWIRDPVQAILAGSLVSLILVFGAAAWLLIRNKPDGRAGWAATAVAFFFCAFAILQSPASYSAVTAVHTDAPALALATIACGLLCRPGDGANRRTRLWLCAVCVVLSIWTKQTMLPLLVALGAFIWLADGAALLKTYVLAVVAAAAVCAGFSVAVFSDEAFFFNVITLATHQPYKPGAWLYMVNALRMAKLDALTALFPILFFLAYQWRGVSGRATTNRWMVFGFAAASLLPGSIKSVATVGGDVNHLGLVLVLLFLGASLAIQQNFVSPDHFRRFGARLFAFVALLVNVTPGALLGLPAALAALSQGDSAIAFRYATRHPARAYFPWNPAVALLTERKLYHFDNALYDREIAGYPPSEQQILSGLPREYRYVAVPPNLSLLSNSLKRAFSQYHPTTDAELPGWTLYARPGE